MGALRPFEQIPSDKENRIMPHTIAVAGKGGVGKTTTCGMLIDYLCKKNKGPVLVVDADEAAANRSVDFAAAR